MNKYTKELHDSIKNSDEEFVKEKYQYDHAKSAAKLSLYHAHGATEKNKNNHRNYKTEQKEALKLNDKVVKSTNSANNVLKAAKQSLVDSGKATSNVSTAATNMQISANAITKLASDVAGINAVVNAADHGRFKDSLQTALGKISEAAKKAEEVSLVSLQATIEAAQSTASTVVNDAEATLAAIKGLHSSTAGRYSGLSEKTVASNEALTESRQVETAAAGTFDIAKKQDKAIKTTRRLINQVSNNDLLLQEKVDEDYDERDENLLDDWPLIGPGKSYTIQFNKFKNEDKLKAYRMVMVKKDAANAFDINLAREMEVGTYHEITPDGADIYRRRFYLLGTDQARIPILPDFSEQKTSNTKASGPFCDEQNVRGIAVDYKGRPIEQGEYYVAFIFAIYRDTTENRVNGLDYYLSLPSRELILQKRPYRVKKYDDELKVYTPFFDSRNFEVSFKVDYEKYNPDKEEFRILMVEADNVKANRINRHIDHLAAQMDKAEYEYNTANNKLNEMLSELQATKAKFDHLAQRVTSLETALETEKDPNVKKRLKKQIKEYQSERDDTLEYQEQLTTEIYTPKTGQEAITDEKKITYQKLQQQELEASKDKKSDFIFDSDLMGVIQKGNYYTATPFKWDHISADIQKREAVERLSLAKLKLDDFLRRFFNAETSVNQEQAQFEKAEAKLADKVVEFNRIEKALQDAELQVLKDKEKKKTKESKKENDEIDLEAMIILLREANLEVEEAQDEVYLAQIALDLAKKEAKKIKDDVSTLTAYSKAIFNKNRSELIFHFAEQYGSEKIDTEDQPQDILFFTELLDDATDNYGEPLQFNELYLSKVALQILADSSDFLSEKERIDQIYQKLHPEFIRKHYAKSSIQYQAVVYTAIKSSDPEDKNKYKDVHSKYADPNALYGVVE
ncbi:hypothetical protein [Reichenbachiella sp.]